MKAIKQFFARLFRLEKKQKKQKSDTSIYPMF
jgi:hypothetical protein